jgi:uncharacterized membrane protein YphA (DoxX/SURF4 family)
VVTDTLIQYVERQLRKEVDAQQVRQVLKAKGWKPKDIDAALAKAGKGVPLPKGAGGAEGTARKEQLEPSAKSAPERYAASDQQINLDFYVLWLLRLGLSSIFLVNSLTAWFDPSGFKKLLEASFFTHWMAGHATLIHLIMLNDLAVGVLILLGRWPLWVFAWAGAWLLAAALIKLTALF